MCDLHVHVTVQEGVGGKQFRMWVDETNLCSFFRRLTFSPDGNLLIVPGVFVVCLFVCTLLLFTILFLPLFLAGRFENGDKVTNMTYIFTKRNLTK